MRCLGRLPVKHDKRTLRFAKYLVPAVLPPPPASVDWTGKATQPWGMMLNNSIGDCTCAAVGHTIQSWTANNGNEITIADQDVLNAYIAVTGQEGAAYNPQTGANDNGCNEIDVLNYWRQTGVGGHKIGAYASVQPTSQQEVMEAIWLFGGCYIGVNLPIAAQYQLDQGQPWDIPSHIGFFQRRQWEPGSWGGHAVVLLAADQNGATCITWGQKQTMTWAWLQTYCEEAYAVFSNDWVSDNNATSPNGFDAVSLRNDLQAITS